MIAITDSGSTKTSWVFIDKNKKKYNYKTIGINPYYQSIQDISNSINSELLPDLEFTEPVEKIFFYGAGLELQKQKDEVKAALKLCFPNAELHVDHDLLAAARAVCGDEKGIACIAGTGSNTCLYDGNDIVKNVHSLGLFLGDEGSGGFLGKLLARDYIRKALPNDVKDKFELFTPDRMEDILDKVYTKPFPNRYLASLAPFIVLNQNEKYCHDLAFESFNLLFQNCISKYDGYQSLPINFIGSIAARLENVLREVAAAHGASIGKVISNPLESLTEYHFKKMAL
jgi:N-acetylglucosamine kinase-like BadF-type ATPase